MTSLQVREVVGSCYFTFPHAGLHLPENVFPAMPGSIYIATLCGASSSWFHINWCQAKVIEDALDMHPTLKDGANMDGNSGKCK